MFCPSELAGDTPHTVRCNTCTGYGIGQGNTERQLLASIEDIVEESLPNKKLADHFQDPEAAKLCILNKIAFCETRQKYYQEMMESGIFVRDFGTRLEEINLTNSGVSKELELQMKFWKEKQQDIESQFKHLYRPMQSNKGQNVKGKKSKKVDHTNKQLSYYAGKLTKEFLIKVCSLWKEIAYVTRDREFKEDEEHLIDIFDVKVCDTYSFD
ncbi:uncharacterized protein LOC110057932 [Orbicella faveolata]|uniref:uncharacterized protein LOC110057932 n=1 Tax=Orbicella faveolata TaxID=48498 RepID=UPI0009E4334F|nr:uncharacterized protein LOC110057932 [Orbicella faveolata]